MEKTSIILYRTYWVLLNTLILVRGQTYTSVIETASGPVRGLIATTIENVDYAAFKGIPYAKPPVGNLRFKPPQEINAWTEVYNAIIEGNICTQFNSATNSSAGSEDCLYINVYTPHTKFNGSISKPVMAWIHGGGFNTGYSNQFLYGPDFLLGEDVIVVTFNYRLSALGFLNLEHENATGNCGLKDQNLALKWVKRNIAQFGGNPDNITIFGQSAGSDSVDLQVLSDMSTGLFRQSISMSGSPLNLYWSFHRRDDALKQAFLLGSRLGINTHSKDVLLQALYNASAADIIVAANYMGVSVFRPSLEKSDIATNEEKFLTECSLSKYLTGNYTKGPHMMGFTANETVYFFRNLDVLLNITLSTLKSLEYATNNAPFLSNLINVLTNEISGLTENSTYRLIKETTDFLYILGIDTKQRLISRNNNYPIYYYRFAFESNYSLHNAMGINFGGVGHADDVPYIFYAPIAQLPLSQPEIATTRQRMLNLYTNFAKYGNPTPDCDDDEVLGITWPDSRANGVHLDIGVNLTTGPRPIDDFVKTLQLFGLGGSPYLNDCTNN